MDDEEKKPDNNEGGNFSRGLYDAWKSRTLDAVDPPDAEDGEKDPSSERPPKVRKPTRTLQEGLEEASFFAEQRLYEEAIGLLEEMRKERGDDPALMERLQQIREEMNEEEETTVFEAGKGPAPDASKSGQEEGTGKAEVSDEEPTVVAGPAAQKAEDSDEEPTVVAGPADDEDTLKIPEETSDDDSAKKAASDDDDTEKIPEEAESTEPPEAKAAETAETSDVKEAKPEVEKAEEPKAAEAEKAKSKPAPGPGGGSLLAQRLAAFKDKAAPSQPKFDMAPSPSRKAKPFGAGLAVTTKEQWGGTTGPVEPPVEDKPPPPPPDRAAEDKAVEADDVERLSVSDIDVVEVAGAPENETIDVDLSIPELPKPTEPPPGEPEGVDAAIAPPPAMEKKSNKKIIIAAGAGGGALLLILILVFAFSGPSKKSKKSASDEKSADKGKAALADAGAALAKRAGPDAAHAPAEPAKAGKKVQLKLTITPDTAQPLVHFRGKDYPGAKFTSPPVDPGSAPETVTVTAPGYKKVELKLALNQTTVRTVGLEPLSKEPEPRKAEPPREGTQAEPARPRARRRRRRRPRATRPRARRPRRPRARKRRRRSRARARLFGLD